MTIRVPLLLLLLVCGAAHGAEPQQPPMLQDQFGGRGGLNDYTGQAVLAIVTTPRKLRWIRKWEAAIRAELPGLVSIRVTDVTDRPTPSYASVAAMLLKRAPADISVLIDLDNEWARRYSLDTKEPCLVLFDGDHNVVATFRGRPKGELVNEVMTALRGYFPAAD